MLTAVPKGWCSWSFDVLDGSRVVAKIDVSWWREKGVLTVDGIDYRVYREGVMSGAFILASPTAKMARAEKPSAFRRCFLVHHGDSEYTLRAESAFRRAFVLFEGNRRIGLLSPAGFFSRRVEVDLPVEVPLPVRVFILWLAVILWKRESDSGVAAAAT